MPTVCNINSIRHIQFASAQNAIEAKYKPVLTDPQVSPEKLRRAILQVVSQPNYDTAAINTSSILRYPGFVKEISEVQHYAQQQNDARSFARFRFDTPLLKAINQLERQLTRLVSNITTLHQAVSNEKTKIQSRQEPLLVTNTITVAGNYLQQVKQFGGLTVDGFRGFINGLESALKRSSLNGLREMWHDVCETSPFTKG